MPFGAKPKCCVCKSNVTILWRKNKDGSVTCNTCALDTTSAATSSGNGHQSIGSGASSSSRKSTRLKNSKVKHHDGNNKGAENQPQGGGNNKRKSKQRTTFKRSSTRVQNPVVVPSSKPIVYYRGSYLSVGDVVSLVDVEEGVFYAQIRGFLEDQYFEKYALLTWLIPTTRSPKDRFDLKTYLIGPEEDVPRKLEYVQFVCHCDLDYFMDRNAIYPLWPPAEPTTAIVLTRSRPQTIPYIKTEQSLSAVKEQGISSEF